MKKIQYLATVFCITLLVGMVTLIQNVGAAEMADVVYQNGKIITMDAKDSVHTAIAVKGGKILLVGSDMDMKSLIGPQTRVVDLEKKAVTPGLIDTHLHFMRYGLKFLQIECMNKSKEDILTEVGKKSKDLSEGNWIRGNGWNQMLWTKKEFPTAADLDAVSGGFPVALIRSDNHALWVNTAALKLAGIDRNTPDPEGGVIMKDDKGEPTGILIDSAMKMVNSKMPPWSAKEMERAYLLADQSYSRHGLTTIHDAGDIVDFNILKPLIESGQVKTRVYSVLDMDAGTARMNAGIKPEIGLYNDHLTIRAIKLKTDGALGSRGALMFEAYSDAPGKMGNELISPMRLDELTQQAYGLGYQVSSHAIGDKANHNVLNAYEKFFAKNKIVDNSVRFNIVHAQVLTPEDLPRLGQMKIPALIQAIHATGDMNMAEDRLGSKRILGAYAWRSLAENKTLLAGGSDSPNDYLSPIYGIHASVTRQDHKNNPAGGWYPEQRLTVKEALATYTRNASMISFEENTKGTLEKGKYADFIVLSDDLLTMNPEDIWKVEILLTVIGGKEVYKK